MRGPPDLSGVTPKIAFSHPVWNMGAKICIDSATMMNKGLEIIEACNLFSLKSSQVEVLVHPQAFLHCAVELASGAVLLNLAIPDMKVSIGAALASASGSSSLKASRAVFSGVEALSLRALPAMEFEQPDFGRFPCLKLAYQVAKTGGTAPAALNAANEVAVQAFIDGELGFTDICPVTEEALSTCRVTPAKNLAAVFAADSEARLAAKGSIAQKAARKTRLQASLQAS